MYEPPRYETDRNPYNWDTPEYNQFENDLNNLRRSNRVKQQTAVSSQAPVRTASSAGGSCLLSIGLLCLAAGAITWYFGLLKIVHIFGHDPLQPDGYDVRAIAVGNRIMDIMSSIFGRWPALLTS